MAEVSPAATVERSVAGNVRDKREALVEDPKVMLELLGLLQSLQSLGNIN